MSEKKELSTYEKQLLGRLHLFPKMDKNSQIRLREEVDIQRMQSKAFDEAFGGELSGIAGGARIAQKTSLLGSMKDVITHPITAAKGKIGASLLKRRNKAPEILVHPHPILSKRAEEINFHEESRADLVEIVRKLGAALRGTKYGDRLGIAAPQIGISKRIFICQGAVCVNPEWTDPKFGEKEEMLEGCYSIPKNQIYKVRRQKYGFAKWYSIDGTERKFKLKGKDARVFQHELDHLDGKCACDIGVLYTPEEHLKSTGQNIIIDEAK